jgi:hypothetical protein
MRKVAALVLMVFTAALGASPTGAAGATAVSTRHHDVARFSARIVEMTSPARLTFRHVDIAISQWSTDQDHRLLARTLLEKGPRAFIDVLCGYPSVGTIAIAGGQEFAIRYAWQVADRDGAQRIYLATDQPIVLAGSEFRPRSSVDPLYFVELRLDRHGDGAGKLSDHVRLSMDESRNVIELRDYDHRPLQLVMVHDERLAD